MPTIRRLVPALSAILLAGAIVGAPAVAHAGAGNALTIANPASAQSQAQAPAPVTAIGGVDDFSFDSFDAVYRLGRTASHESTLTTTETLVAEFPQINQNRGIVRAIPADYDGHPTQIQLLSVTDGAGHRRSFDTKYDSGFYQVTIAVPKGQYVHGAQTYVISYTQQDVTRYFPDTHDDEFYWDVNGTAWAQPFAEVSAKVTMSAALAARLNGNSACYWGSEGSTQKCTISSSDSTFTASQTDLQPNQNVTVAIGFSKGTFAAASANPLVYVPATAVFGVIIGILTLLFTLLVSRIWGRRGTGIVVAQYTPPPGVTVMVAANMVGATKRGFAAAIVDLAVRGKLKLHVRKSGLFGMGEDFGVQPLDDTGLEGEESSVFAAVSLGSLGSGVAWMKKKDTELGKVVQSITKTVATQIEGRGLRRKPPRGSFVLVVVLSVVSVGLLGVTVANATNDIATGVGSLGTFVTLVMAVIALSRISTVRPLTREGALLTEYLEGLKLYIRLAEGDRLRMLQSVTGAERIDTTDSGQIVKIYEKLLPYATLFGLEHEWAGELSKYYDANPPNWYDGGNIGAFNAGYFAGSIGSFTSSTSSSYSGSAVSSGSGGAGGGGGSGGGGGGGGGGGV